MPLDRLVEFFYECDKEENKGLEFTLVSANSDYSLCYQNEFPVMLDMQKWTNFIDWDREVQGYEDVILKARCYKHQCNIRDKYSLRFYSFTGFTFNSIPESIKKWYCTNCNIVHHKITRIPFGVPEWFIQGFNPKFIKEFKERKIDVYVNFQINTLERQYIKNYCRQLLGKTPINIVVEPDVISHEDYIKNLGNSKFVVCPEGNGFDCYRSLESIYSGCIPLFICSNPNRWSSCYQATTFQDIHTALTSLNDIQIKLDNPVYFTEYWRENI